MKDVEPPEFSSHPLAYGMDSGIADHIAARARISRRDFLRILSAAATGTALASACARVGLTPVGSATPDKPAMTAPALTKTINTETPKPSETPTPEPTPEIGGEKSVVLWMDINMNTYKLDSTIPPEFAPYLVPTPPEQWASLDTLTMSDGKPIPWGGAITYLEVGDPFGKWPVIPGLVRGVVEYGTYAGKPRYGAIIEFPVKGGSVFYITRLLAIGTNAYLPTSQLIPGAYPVECTGGVVCKGEQVYVALTNSDSMNDPDMVSLLQRLTGKMALFPMRPYPEHQVVINAIAHGSLATGEAQGTPPVPEIWYQP